MGMTTSAMAIAGTAMQAMGNRQAGNAAAAQGAAQQTAADYRAASLDQQANASRAYASQQAYASTYQTGLLESTIRARAAASGAGAVNPTVVNLEQGVAGRGEYNELSALYSGEERAQGLDTQAALDRYTGQQQFTAGKINQSLYNTRAISSVLSGASSLFAKYGAGGVSGQTNPWYGQTVPAGAAPL